MLLLENGDFIFPWYWHHCHCICSLGLSSISHREFGPFVLSVVHCLWVSQYNTQHNTWLQKRCSSSSSSRRRSSSHIIRNTNIHAQPLFIWILSTTEHLCMAMTLLAPLCILIIIVIILCCVFCFVFVSYLFSLHNHTHTHTHARREEYSVSVTLLRGVFFVLL